LENAARLGVVDDPLRRAILDRAAGIEEFRFADDRAAERRAQLGQDDMRRAADGAAEPLAWADRVGGDGAHQTVDLHLRKRRVRLFDARRRPRASIFENECSPSAFSVLGPNVRMAPAQHELFARRATEVRKTAASG
jgi:hypothetical protein